MIACLEENKDRRNFMVRVRKAGMDDGTYLYILPDYVSDVGQQKFWLQSTGLNSDGQDAEARLAFNKALTVRLFLLLTHHLWQKKT